MCYWATSELGISQAWLSKRLELSQPAISLSVARGRTIAVENNYDIEELIVRRTSPITSGEGYGGTRKIIRLFELPLPAADAQTLGIRTYRLDGGEGILKMARTKVSLKETHERGCIHKIRITRCS